METETIAEALGHSVATVTDIYIKFNRRKTKPPKKDAQPRQHNIMRIEQQQIKAKSLGGVSEAKRYGILCEQSGQAEKLVRKD